MLFGWMGSPLSDVCPDAALESEIGKLSFRGYLCRGRVLWQQRGECPVVSTTNRRSVCNGPGVLSFTGHAANFFYPSD